MLVQRQIRDQALELTVFVSQLPQFAQLAYPYSGIPSLPDIERLLRHAHFPANVADLLPGLDLPHREQNLFFAMTFSRHPCSSCCLRSEDHIHPPDSTFPLSHFWVLGHNRSHGTWVSAVPSTSIVRKYTSHFPQRTIIGEPGVLGFGNMP